MNVIITPSCPICLKNYSCTVIPKMFFPCGHGACSKCMIQYKEHKEDEELTCPLCRQEIKAEFENYELQEITNKVNTDELSYWSRRLVEAVELPGVSITINDQIKSMSKSLFTRLVYKDEIRMLENAEEILWTIDEKQKVKMLSNTFIKALLRSDMESKEALNWITVLNVPTNVENVLLANVHKFYKAKQFLTEIDGEWLLDAFSE